MYNDDPNIAAAQKIMLEILIEIHKICVENDITYWLEAGTLLGAVRHKGFIPWDDDCDVAMPRKDYDRFMKIAQEKLPKNMFLQNQNTDPKYPLPWAKVRKLNTLLVETGETGEENYCHGIFVDIFPYDYYKYKWFTRWMKWSRFFKEKKKKYPKGSFRRTAVMLYTNILMGIPAELSVLVRKYFCKHKEYFQDENYVYFSYGLECHSVKATTVKDLLPTVYHEGCFEGYGFYLPNNSANVLKENFGDDYMSLPPENKRLTHAKLIKTNLE